MCYGHGVVEIIDISFGFIMYFEEGVDHGKITYDKTLCGMVMGFQEML